MNLFVLFLFIVFFYLLPIIPAILFYKLSPKSVVEEARTIASYGPISVKLGGAAAFYLAFFFLLNQTPLMGVLEEAFESQVMNSEVSLKGTVVLSLDENIQDEANKKAMLKGALSVLNQASVFFEPNHRLITETKRLDGNKITGTIEIDIPLSWVQRLQSTNTSLQIDPEVTNRITLEPIFITKRSFTDQSIFGRDEIELNEIEIDLMTPDTQQELTENQIDGTPGPERRDGQPVRGSSTAAGGYKSLSESSL